MNIGIPIISGVVSVAVMNRYIKTNPNYDTILGDIKISIILPTLNEQETVVETLKCIHEQSILKENPDKFEIILVDSNSQDRTVELAKPFVDRIIIAPLGLITSRNIGVCEANGDIIVLIDADTTYPSHWLNTLLYPFSDPEVVLVSAPVFFEGNSSILSMKLARVGMNFSAPVLHLCLGQNMAFTKDAFIKVGGFKEEGVDQLNVVPTWFELEYNFANRMIEVGKYVWEWHAFCVTSPRRYTEKEFKAQVGVIRQ